MTQPTALPSESAGERDTTDDQIENLLREVEELKASSPIKHEGAIKPGLSTTDEPTPQTTSTPLKTKDESVETDDNFDDLVDMKAETATTRQIPKSVSQALFTSTVKVMKVRDKTVAPKFIGMKPKEDPESFQKIETLQQSERELSNKTRKLRSEISYLQELIDTASISSNLNELRKLKFAIERLGKFLDQKEKEKYEVGIQLTRMLRKRVDSGDYGEFWSN